MAQEKKYDVFISYSRKDYDEVKAFVDMLKERIPKLDVWMDLEKITVADEFDEKIISAINASSYVIFAVSTNSNSIGEGSSKWTKKELVYAQNTNKKVIPVLLNGAKLNSWFLFEFGRTEGTDTTDTLQIKKLIENLSFLTNKPTLEEELRREKLVRKDDDIEQAKRDALPAGEFQVGDLMYKASENSGGVTVCGLINEGASEIHIPSQIQYGNYTYDVDSIGDNAFILCLGLTSITIPNSVTSIGDKAFSFCDDLTSISIPNSVTSIGKGAFFECSGLTSITIPNSVTCVGLGAFDGCSGLTSITIPNSVTSIGYYAFAYCSGLTSITIPNSVMIIGDEAFRGCSGLTSIKFPNSVTSIGDKAFSGCDALKYVKIPKTYIAIGKDAFPEHTQVIRE